MTEELRKDFEPGAELGRSPSGAAGSEGGVGEAGARDGIGAEPAVGEGEPAGLDWRRRRRRRRGVLEKPELVRGPLTAAKKILLLDTWHRSGLPARDFAALTGLSHHTLYVWQHKFKLEGPAGLEEKPRGAPRGSRLGEVVRRAILMMKDAHPEWGTERIAAMLLRGPGLGATPESEEPPVPSRRIVGEAGRHLASGVALAQVRDAPGHARGIMEVDMPGGRPPKGVDLVDGLEGSQEAKKRLRAALETLGERSIEEVCEELGVKASSVHELRGKALQAALEALEAKPVGRPRKKEKGAEEMRIERLEAKLESMRLELALARAREELHAAMPYLAERERVRLKKTKAEEKK